MKKVLFILLFILVGCAEPKPKYILDLTPVDYTPNYVIDGVELRKKYKNNYYTLPRQRPYVEIDGVKNFRDFYKHIYLTVAKEYYCYVPEVYESFPIGELAEYVVLEFTDDELKAIAEIKDEKQQEELILALEKKYREYVIRDMNGHYNRNIKVKKNLINGGYDITVPDSDDRALYPREGYQIDRIIKDNYKFGFWSRNI